MSDTYEDSIKNWQLPLNHTITCPSMSSKTRFKADLPDYMELANVFKACRRLGGPFDANYLYQLIGGNVRLYNN
jgi:hypothetical protein